MKTKVKTRDIYLAILAVVFVLGTSLVFWVKFVASAPRWETVQESRSISISGSDGFSISPAKVLITNIWDKRPVVIPVKITNTQGDSTFIIGDNPPAIFDTGYVDAQYRSDYKFICNYGSSIRIPGYSTATIYITVTKLTKGGDLTDQEKGMSIAQLPEPDSQGKRVLSIVRENIFEILVK